MPKEGKKGSNIVKIQVEAKNPRRKSVPKAAPGAIPRQLVENMVSMQKVYANIAEKLDRLSGQISSLLTLFESAAKTFAQNPNLQVAGKDKEFIDKIDKLLEQDRVIAKTLSLLEERTREHAEALSPAEQPQQSGAQSQAGFQASAGSVGQQNRPLPRY